MKRKVNGIHVNSDVCKNLKVTETDNNGEDNNGEDIISNLPENIISRVLSHLPMKDVMRTCVLSKDWEYRWTSIYNIDIDDGIPHSRERFRITSFVNFVDKVLFLSRNRTIKRFRLSCQRHNYNPGRMVTWISAALMRNVEDMDLAYAHEGVALPRCLFYCKSLTKLKLQVSCIFRVPAQNLFSSLKILYLAEVKFLDERVPNTNQLMIDFPVLEMLELRNCKWLKVNFVEIISPALTKFSVMCYLVIPEVDKCQIKISGAKLVEFKFVGCFIEDFDFSASSVFSAAINSHCYSDYFHLTRNGGSQALLLLKELSGLNDLKISGVVVEAITLSKQGPPLPKFNMLKRLEVSSKCNGGALLELLHVMPFLESIVLEMWFWDDYDYDQVESVPSCIVYHLKEVQFRRFSERRPDVRLAHFLLTNALQLKKMLGLCRESCKERQMDKISGFFREESEEREVENFWEKFNSVFKEGRF